MVLFATTIPYSTSTGAYVSGRWVDGAPVVSSFSGNVQPVTDEDVKALPEGYNTTGLVKVYADIELAISANGGDKSGAVITWQGKQYKIIQKLDYQYPDLLPHYKYIAMLME